MKTKPAPTRGNLSKVKKALELARRGHDLLEQKRQILMMELMKHLESAREVQGEMKRLFEEAYSSLQRANVSMGIDNVEEMAQSIPVTDVITIRLRSVMGVDIPEVDPIAESPMPSYSLIGSSCPMDRAYLNARKVLSLILKLAEVENSVYRLAVQIRKTYRRVNALKKVIIPYNQEAERFISDALEEMDREDFVRMKAAKEGRGGEEN
ncbi:H(+)-transporting ATP synthase, vacuolar type, subunit D [Thermanaerovibrio velox DSM 12556]|uniref:V-type ATP synthase subunit D n=1 Tax=Thermanaerovibrio velox DSM 12556 TaxID=926567 RepID=H0UNC1_9BACT|nr:V-type ATP synthase subunit D [Thermanaerovibrio velox]EHM10406.1 H(+)-transporting ATP synthase, vacuolar type, subunit D [Thermanaerovibrio velox DSM 12556]